MKLKYEMKFKLLHKMSYNIILKTELINLF